MRSTYFQMPLEDLFAHILLETRQISEGLRHVDIFSTVPGYGYETARCARHAAILNPLAASVSSAFCSALM